MLQCSGKIRNPDTGNFLVINEGIYLKKKKHLFFETLCWTNKIHPEASCFRTLSHITTFLLHWQHQLERTLFCSVLIPSMFTSAEDVYSPGKWLPNRNICFSCCGKSSICWEAKKTSQTLPPTHFSLGQFRKAFADLFVSLRTRGQCGLGMEEAPLYRWSASLHLRTADSTPDIKGRPWSSQQNPLDPNTPLSTWGSVLPSSSSRPPVFSGPVCS